MHLFVYGTLLDPALLVRLTGQPASLRPALLDGFRRVRLRGTPYPTLMRGSGTVRGALLQADQQSFRRLHRYEGPRYRLTRLRARPIGARATIAAFAWIAPGGTRQPWP